MTVPLEVKIPREDAISISDASIQWLWDLIEQEQPRVVVEAGTYTGRFAIMAACTVRQWGGRVYSADPILYGAADVARHNDLTDEHLNLVVDDFAEIGRRYPEIIGRVDFALIDSGAPFALTWEDGVRYRHYQLAKSWLRPGGVIVVDDLTTTDWYGNDLIRREADLVSDVGHGFAVKRC